MITCIMKIQSQELLIVSKKIQIKNEIILKVMKKALPKEIFRARQATANPSHSARTARIIGFRITAPSIALFCFRLALSLVLCVSDNGHWYCQRHRKGLLMQKGWRWRFFIEAVALCQSAKWWRFFFIMMFFFKLKHICDWSFLKYQQLMKLKIWHYLCNSSDITIQGGGKSKSGWFPTVHCGLHECVD